MPHDFDFFISHASEDKDSVAIPLAKALADRGYRVWFDKQELTIGDRLLSRINSGLSRSRFGVVILSRDFFVKNWPQWELEGLMALEDASGRKVVLPVRHGLSQQELAETAPVLAARLSGDTSQGIDDVTEGLVAAAKTASGSPTANTATPDELEPLDLYADAQDSYERGIAATRAIVEALPVFTAGATAYTARTKALAESGTRLSAKELRTAINEVTPVFRGLTSTLHDHSVEMKTEYGTAFLSLARAAALESPDPGSQSRKRHAATLARVREGAAGAKEVMIQMRGSVEALKSYTIVFKRARRELSTAIQTTADALDSVIEDATLAIQMLTPTRPE